MRVKSSPARNHNLARLAWCLAWCLCLQSLLASCASQPHYLTFKTPEDAASALVEAVRADRREEVIRILGPESREVIDSGDKVGDQSARSLFLEAYQRKNRVERGDDDTATLYIGEIDWPFPFPLVKTDDGWAFDGEEGREVVIDRRIGRNELDTIQVCLACAEAQDEYHSEDRDGDGLLEYAQKLRSSPGKKDGLYWETREGEKPSPLGPLMAMAGQEGYTPGIPGGEPQPYHGYFYRPLKGQGPNAPGGAYDYLVRGSMIGGFAIVAYPASYGLSGVKTFMINHEGVVYEKDLGDETTKRAREMSVFDPDSSWSKTAQ